MLGLAAWQPAGDQHSTLARLTHDPAPQEQCWELGPRSRDGDAKGSPAAAGIAAKQQLLALAADGALGLVAIFIVHVEELQESILAK